jgi:hypothetical protein
MLLILFAVDPKYINSSTIANLLLLVFNVSFCVINLIILVFSQFAVRPFFFYLFPVLLKVFSKCALL